MAVRRKREAVAKRILDVVWGGTALLLTLGFYPAVAILQRMTGDRGPLIYRARRFGVAGALIDVPKFRTMRPTANGSMLTRRGDPRITRLGRILRMTKLDEIPQLVAVVRGDMSLVGPRPEDPAFVDWSDPLHRRVFTARPGITGPAQIQFRDEEWLLDGPDSEAVYRSVILPAKLRLDADYLDRPSLRRDVALLARTGFAVIRRSSPLSDSVLSGTGNDDGQQVRAEERDHPQETGETD